eukprot:Rhum_TRINITY_DN14282_c12_g2::Rhum_TRINITY_DN14282_c12_g2_i1::g.79063::m.79063
MVWNVFPRPISSARMPDKHWWCIASIQLTPSTWYGRSVPPRYAGFVPFGIRGAVAASVSGRAAARVACDGDGAAADSASASDATPPGVAGAAAAAASSSSSDSASTSSLNCSRSDRSSSRICASVNGAFGVPGAAPPLPPPPPLAGAKAPPPCNSLRPVYASHSLMISSNFCRALFSSSTGASPFLLVAGAFRFFVGGPRVLRRMAASCAARSAATVSIFRRSAAAASRRAAAVCAGICVRVSASARISLMPSDSISFESARSSSSRAYCFRAAASCCRRTAADAPASGRARATAIGCLFCCPFFFGCSTAGARSGAMSMKYRYC